ncbi:hypothetical protein BHE74_00020269 [Ensete ventricosum]|nr:hypothetical protein BHE74_00020269 [Ensete ventricosum]
MKIEGRRQRQLRGRGESSSVTAIMRMVERETLAAAACDRTQWDARSSFDLLGCTVTEVRRRCLDKSKSRTEVSLSKSCNGSTAVLTCIAFTHLLWKQPSPWSLKNKASVRTAVSKNAGCTATLMPIGREHGGQEYGQG